MIKERVLIIGGGGFIGTHLARFLVSKGYAITILEREGFPGPFLEGDISYKFGDYGDSKFLKKILKGIKWVFHLVHTTFPASSNKDPIYDVTSNLPSSINLFQACVENCVEKIIFPSSGGTVYGRDVEKELVEEDPTNPICSYGITKLALEKYLYLFHHIYGLEYRILRISNPYGEYQQFNRSQGIINVILEKSLKGETIEIWGDGSVIRDYIYIGDVIEAMYNAATIDGLSERLFNIGSGKGLSILDIIKQIRQCLNIEIVIDWKPGRNIDVPVSVLNIDKAKEYLEWVPHTSLEEGINKTVKWMQTELGVKCL